MTFVESSPSPSWKILILRSQRYSPSVINLCIHKTFISKRRVDEVSWRAAAAASGGPREVTLATALVETKSPGSAAGCPRGGGAGRWPQGPTTTIALVSGHQDGMSPPDLPGPSVKVGACAELGHPRGLSQAGEASPA